MDNFIILVASVIIGLLTYIALSLGSISKDVWKIKNYLDKKGE